MVVLEGVAVSYERGTPVRIRCVCDAYQESQMFPIRVSGCANAYLLCRCRAKLEHTRQSMPDSGLGLSHFQYASPSNLLSWSLLARQRTLSHRGRQGVDIYTNSQRTFPLRVLTWDDQMPPPLQNATPASRPDRCSEQGARRRRVGTLGI